MAPNRSSPALTILNNSNNQSITDLYHFIVILGQIDVVHLTIEIFGKLFKLIDVG